jgi:hypothetical protein
MAMHWAIFLPVPLVIAFVVAVVRAKTTKQRELAAAGLLLGLGLIAGVSALLGYGS